MSDERRGRRKGRSPKPCDVQISPSSSEKISKSGPSGSAHSSALIPHLFRTNFYRSTELYWVVHLAHLFPRTVRKQLLRELLVPLPRDVVVALVQMSASYGRQSLEAEELLARSKTFLAVLRQSSQPPPCGLRLQELDKLGDVLGTLQLHLDSRLRVSNGGQSLHSLELLLLVRRRGCRRT